MNIIIGAPKRKLKEVTNLDKERRIEVKAGRSLFKPSKRDSKLGTIKIRRPKLTLVARNKMIIG